MKKTPHLAVIRSEPRDPVELLADFHSGLSGTCRCTDVDAWCETGAEFQVQSNDGHRVEVVLAQLFDSKLGHYFVLISNLRSWKSWFWKTESP